MPAWRLIVRFVCACVAASLFFFLYACVVLNCVFYFRLWGDKFIPSGDKFVISMPVWL